MKLRDSSRNVVVYCLRRVMAGHVIEAVKVSDINSHLGRFWRGKSIVGKYLIESKRSAVGQKAGAAGNGFGDMFGRMKHRRNAMLEIDDSIMLGRDFLTPRLKHGLVM